MRKRLWITISMALMISMSGLLTGCGSDEEGEGSSGTDGTSSEATIGQSPVETEDVTTGALSSVTTPGDETDVSTPDNTVFTEETSVDTTGGDTDVSTDSETAFSTPDETDVASTGDVSTGGETDVSTGTEFSTGEETPFSTGGETAVSTGDTTGQEGTTGGETAQSTGEETGESTAPSATVSLLNDIQIPIFTPKCSCHSGPNPSSDLNLEEGQTWSNTVNVQSTQTIRGGVTLNRIEPGRPSLSYLYLKVINDPKISGSAMPTGAPLSPEEIQAIETWILEGAQDN